MARNNYNPIAALIALGVSADDAAKRRRISMTLRRWHELECGIETGGVDLEEVTKNMNWYSSVTGKRTSFPDREAGALKRLAAVMANYPALRSYVQGDPRGCALYILLPEDIPNGAGPAYYYNLGIAVY